MQKEIFEQPKISDAWISRYLPDGLPLKSPVAFPFENDFYNSIEKIQREL